jgi:mRNA-degrading endonuclease RelE of RelBE toxin-antitoxin system
MKGEENVWRRRAGAYRIFYELIPKTKIIYVFRVERRTSKTY